MSTIKYCPEIDGLRAIAVLSVLLFHAEVSVLKGGFVGVDIFYVISGYLIFSIIHQDLLHSTFSFTSFYQRRIKRLLPAALAMISTTLLIGYFFLAPDKYIELSKSGLAAVFFTSNFWFMLHSGYFDISTLQMPLLHMWSLSIEEQFYFIFPPLILLSYRFKKTAGLKFLIIFSTAISFILCMALSEKNLTNISFYLLFTRSWEMSLGAVIVFLPKISNNLIVIKKLLCYLGLILILISLVLIDESSIFPGVITLLPVFGTFLIVYSSRDEPLGVGILSNQLMRFIGKISYSVYLWHWPIIVFYRIYINDQPFSNIEITALIAFSLITGYLSWRFIESAFRNERLQSRSIYLTALLFTLIPVSLASVILFTNGFPQRLSAKEISISHHHLMTLAKCTEKMSIKTLGSFCIIGVPWLDSSIKGVVWGDSHSQHYSQLLHEQAIINNISLVIAPRQCPPYLGIAGIQSHYPKFRSITRICQKKNTAMLNWLNENSDITLVIMAAAWSGHARMLYTTEHTENLHRKKLSEGNAKIGSEISAKGLQYILSKLKEKNILLLSDMPRPNKSLNSCALSTTTTLLRQVCSRNDFQFLDAKDVHEWHENSDDILIQMSEKFSHVSAIIPSQILCSKEFCPTFINDELIYRDSNHLRLNLTKCTAEILAHRLRLDRYLSGISQENSSITESVCSEPLLRESSHR